MRDVSHNQQVTLSQTDYYSYIVCNSRTGCLFMARECLHVLVGYRSNEYQIQSSFVLTFQPYRFTKDHA